MKYNENIKNYINLDGSPANRLDIENNKCVGSCDWFDSKAYYKFLDSDIVRFNITPKKRLLDNFNKNWISSRYYNSFRSVEKRLNDFGWHTFDLG